MSPEVFGIICLVLLAVAAAYGPQIAQARREREMLERMKALRDADEVMAVLDTETSEVREEADAARKFRGGRF